MKLSVLMITKNNEDVVWDALTSVQGLADEIVISDDGSTDCTVDIVKRFGAVVVGSENKNLGERKQSLVEGARGTWILLLDSDERVSKELKKEIQKIQRHNDTKVNGYKIPYQNYVFGKPVRWGGERYSKVRFFRKGYGSVTQVPLHEEVSVKGKIGTLYSVIHHHSFRTPIQLIIKFTKYAWMCSREKKRQGERVNIAKLLLYGPHMFWARFMKEQGYKDGWRGLLLALAFAYMEALTYWLMFV